MSFMIEIFGAAPRMTWKQTLVQLQRKGTLSRSADLGFDSSERPVIE